MTQKVLCFGDEWYDILDFHVFGEAQKRVIKASEDAERLSQRSAGCGGQLRLNFSGRPPSFKFAAQHDGGFVGIFGFAYFILFFAVAASAFPFHGMTTTLAVAIIGIFGFWGPTNATYRSVFFGDRSLSKVRVAIGALAIGVVVMIVTDFRLSVLQYLLLLLACGALYLDFVRKQDTP